MIIARLIPRLRDLPQCEAVRSSPYANDYPDTDKQCRRHAKFQIGDKMLCQRHASVAALDALLAANEHNAYPTPSPT